MSTVLDILYAAALNINAVVAGDDLDAREASDILAAWNRLIQSDNLDNSAVFTTRNDSYNTASTQSYTFGTDANGNPGTLSAVRPNTITGVDLMFQGFIYPRQLRPLSEEQFRNVIMGIISVPDGYYIDGGYPVLTMTLNFIPSLAGQLRVWQQQPLSTQSNLDDLVVFPDGYERYWITQLAIEIAPMFKAKVSSALLRNAERAEQAVKSHNRKSPRISCGPDLIKSPAISLIPPYYGAPRP